MPALVRALYGTAEAVPYPKPNSYKAGALGQKKQEHRPRMRDQVAATVDRSVVAVIAAGRAVRVPAEVPVVPAKAAVNTSGAKRFASSASRRSRRSITKMCVYWRSSWRKA